MACQTRLTDPSRGLQANYTCVGIDVIAHEGVAADGVLTEYQDGCRLLQADVSSVEQVCSEAFGMVQPLQYSPPYVAARAKSQHHAG